MKYADLSFTGKTLVVNLDRVTRVWGQIKNPGIVSVTICYDNGKDEFEIGASEANMMFAKIIKSSR